MATSGYVLSGTRKAQLDKALTRYDECKSSHATFSAAYDRRERSYLGVLRRQSNASKWKHQLHPPYAFNLLETIIASSVEQGLVLSARPSPHGKTSLDEATAMLEMSGDVEALIRHEHRIDDMDDKQRPFFLTAGIGGRGVLKTGWEYSEGMVRRQGVTEQEIHDEDGNLLAKVPTISEITEQGVLRDHSTTTVVDPRDFIVHPAARQLQPWEEGGAQCLFHRMYFSTEQLQMMEKAGFLKDVQYLENYERGSTGTEYNDRTSEVYNQDRTKNQHEILEYWCLMDGEIQRMWIGNKSVILRDLESNPFWHGGYPFVVGSSMPLPFNTIGMSEIELIEQLQEMLWETQNQRLDNLEFVNNAIYLIRSDVEDPTAFKPFPGAIWEVEDTQQVEMLRPEYQVAEISLHAEATLKGDLQTVTSAVPFAGGSDSQTVDNQTATGASIVMNAAQQRMSYRKYEFQKGLKREANMRLKNLQQFIDGSRLAHVIGQDGAQEFKQISVLDIQGDYVFELEPMSESQMRTERRAEAQQFFQVAMSAAPAFAMSPWPMNLKELFLDMAKLWGKEDAEKFFSGLPAAAGVAAAPGGAGGAGGAAPPGGPNLGITSGQAVDASSPSAAGGIGGSPVGALQRALAMGGGVNNGGGGG